MVKENYKQLYVLIYTYVYEFRNIDLFVFIDVAFFPHV